MSARLHHIGFVVRSIEDAAESFAQSMGCLWSGQVILDPVQQAKVSFFESAANQPQLELVAPADENSPIHRFLAKQGGGLHHLCYETDDLDRQIQQARATGAALVQKPVPAVAFDGRRIAWVYTRQRMLLEYLER